MTARAAVRLPRGDRLRTRMDKPRTVDGAGGELSQERLRGLPEEGCAAALLTAAAHRDIARTRHALGVHPSERSLGPGLGRHRPRQPSVPTRSGRLSDRVSPVPRQGSDRAGVQAGPARRPWQPSGQVRQRSVPSRLAETAPCLRLPRRTGRNSGSLTIRRRQRSVRRTDAMPPSHQGPRPCAGRSPRAGTASCPPFRQPATGPSRRPGQHGSSGGNQGPQARAQRLFRDQSRAFSRTTRSRQPSRIARGFRPS